MSIEITWVNTVKLSEMTGKQLTLAMTIFFFLTKCELWLHLGGK